MSSGKQDGGEQLELIVDLETMGVSQAKKIDKMPDGLKLAHPFLLDCKFLKLTI